jgi:hypothetical protein
MGIGIDAGAFRYPTSRSGTGASRTRLLPLILIGSRIIHFGDKTCEVSSYFF